MKNKEKLDEKIMDNNLPEITEEELAVKKRERQRRWKRINRVFDRLAGFIIVFVLVIGFTGLAFDYLCVKGPSESLDRKSVV